jgi:stearoyl-CoA desaturase (delta-9 desaturase)
VPISHLVAALVAAFVVTQMAVAATTVYLHRATAHRALTLKPAAALPFRFVVWITTGQRPRQWAAVHRKHHAATDTPEDPHSPLQLGFWRVQLGNVGLYRKAASNEVLVHKYGRDVPADRLDRMFFDHALFGLGVGIAMLVSVMWILGFGLLTGFVGAGFHAVLYLMLASAINAVGHTFGKRPYPNSATNMQSLALLTGGEGLHNNHHAAPTSAKFALAKGEIDPGWWLIRVLARFHLASIRHDEVKLKSAA